MALAHRACPADRLSVRSDVATNGGAARKNACATRQLEVYTRSRNAVEKRAAQVSLACVGEDGDDGFAFKLGLLGQPACDGGGSPARNSGKKAFFASQAPSVFDRLFVSDLLHPINDRKVESIRDEAGADALYQVVMTRPQAFPCQFLGDHRAKCRLDAYRQDLLALFVLDVSGHAGDRAAGTNTGHQHVDAAVGVFQISGPVVRK